MSIGLPFAYTYVGYIICRMMTQKCWQVARQQVKINQIYLQIFCIYNLVGEKRNCVKN